MSVAGRSSVNATGTPGSALDMMALIRELYPICRSITGNGVRRTLEIVGRYLPLETFEVPSGTPAFDWTVPDEWNIRDAFIADMEGRKLVDFGDSTLHVLNYSVPVDAVIDRESLEQHLYSLPEHPDRIPYRTTYYSRKWGFCLPHRLREQLTDPQYRVKIDSSLEPGTLTYAECFIPGETDREILLYTHVCHPSLCNDNLSGIAVATALGRRLLDGGRRRFGCRIVFGPGTIGSIVWLSQNRERLGKVAHGLVIGLLGDAAPHTYKRTRDGDCDIDRVAEYVLTQMDTDHRIIDFSPYGYDERQFGSPGIRLPVGRLTRSVNGGYDEYHSSADDLDIVSEERLASSVEIVAEMLDVLDMNRCYENLQPWCEPQLGKRGLYRDTGGSQIADRESAMLWLLNQSDGAHTLLDIAQRSGIGIRSLAAVAAELEAADLLAERNRSDEVKS